MTDHYKCINKAQPTQYSVIGFYRKFIIKIHIHTCIEFIQFSLIG